MGKFQRELKRVGKQVARETERIGKQVEAEVPRIDHKLRLEERVIRVQDKLAQLLHHDAKITSPTDSNATPIAPSLMVFEGPSVSSSHTETPKSTSPINKV